MMEVRLDSLVGDAFLDHIAIAAGSTESACNWLSDPDLFLGLGAALAQLLYIVQIGGDLSLQFIVFHNSRIQDPPRWSPAMSSLETPTQIAWPAPARDNRKFAAVPPCSIA